MTQLTESRINDSVTNEQPKAIAYMPTGDNIDVSGSEWHDVESEQGDIEDIEDVVEDIVEDVNEDVNEDFNEDDNKQSSTEVAKDEQKKSEKIYNCDICEKSYSSKGGLNKHKTKKHKE